MCQNGRKNPRSNFYIKPAQRHTSESQQLVYHHRLIGITLHQGNMLDTTSRHCQGNWQDMHWPAPEASRIQYIHTLTLLRWTCLCRTVIDACCCNFQLRHSLQQRNNTINMSGILLYECYTNLKLYCTALLLEATCLLHAFFSHKQGTRNKGLVWAGQIFEAPALQQLTLYLRYNDIGA